MIMTLPVRRTTTILLQNSSNNTNGKYGTTIIPSTIVTTNTDTNNNNGPDSCGSQKKKKHPLMTSMRMQRWIMLITSVLLFILFQIESIIYKEIIVAPTTGSTIMENGEGKGANRLLRYYKEDDDDNNDNKQQQQRRQQQQQQQQQPVARNGFIPRGLLRTSSIIMSLKQFSNDHVGSGTTENNNGKDNDEERGAIMTFDNFDIERMEYDLHRINATSRSTKIISTKKEKYNGNYNNNNIKNNRRITILPRTIELDDQLNNVIMKRTTTLHVGNNANNNDNNLHGYINHTSTMKPRIMELEEDNNDDDDVDDDNETAILDFERPWYEECETILTPPSSSSTLPIVHPTCNDIHESFILPTMLLGGKDTTTNGSNSSNNSSSLLSMKGSWRSVWKVNDNEINDNYYHHILQQSKTNSSVISSAASIPTLVTTASPPPSVVVMKVLHLHRRFDEESFNAHGTDIMVMDRLTASPYVVTAYSFCGQSVVTEYADTLGRDYVKRYDIGSQERLRVARDLARGLADVQALQPLPHSRYIANNDDDHNNNNTNDDVSSTIYDDSPNTPIVFAHNDITIANTVMINGRIKWNDFNIGVFLRKRKKKQDNSNNVDVTNNDLRTTTTIVTALDLKSRRHERDPKMKSNRRNKAIYNETSTPFSLSTSPLFTAFNKESNNNYNGIQNDDTMMCPSPVKFRNDLWRSPEEVKNISYVQLTQADVYGLGNILYQTMTRHQPWSFKEKGGIPLTKADVVERKIGSNSSSSAIPTIPEQYLNTTKRALQTLFAATNLCYYTTPAKRPTARRLAYGFGILYNKIKSNNNKSRVTRKMILDYLVVRSQ